jgi:molecular chaperone GrpE
MAPVPSQEAELKAQLDERTADLQRLQAEYANYRKRIDRDREVVVNTAKASVATELLPVLDDIERAAQHGDLTGAFKAVADKLMATLERTGLESFGHDGEPFDPAVHEAVQHDTSPDVTGPTVTAVLRRGYRFGDRVVREALVAVTDHEPAPAAPAAPAEEPSMPSSEWYDPNNPDGHTADQD